MNTHTSTPLTVGLLKKLLAEIPDDTPVGVCDWFGDLEVFVLEELYYCPDASADKGGPSLRFPHMDFGEEPD